MQTLKIGTRGSHLALVQARAVAALLSSTGRIDTTIVEIRTSGDRLANADLSSEGGKGLFVKELEEALLAGHVDIAVHSSKDMPADLPEGLTLAAALTRENPADAVVLPQPPQTATFDEIVRRLGAAPVLATSSIRRIAQLSPAMPGATFRPIRGNVDTRIRKLADGEADALILAAAGLHRLGLQHHIASLIPVDTCLPAPGQGTVAIEARLDDARTLDLVATINDDEALACLRAERAVVSRLGGGCQMPIAAYATVDGGRLWLRCAVMEPTGARRVRAEVHGAAGEAARVGAAAAERLLSDGAEEILSALRSGANARG